MLEFLSHLPSFLFGVAVGAIFGPLIFMGVKALIRRNTK